MGARGPQRQSSNVIAFRGNPGHKTLADLVDDFNPEVEIPSAPRWIWPEAKKEWRRIGTELERYGLISKLDRAALVLYCQSWARLAWAETMLSRAMELAETKRQEAEDRGEEWKGGDGIMVPSPNGSLIYSHHWVVQRRAAQEVHWYLQSFGLSPSSRSRVRMSNNRQGSLFEEGTQDAWNSI
jgi:P27 family predicted phage terminase small subunit